jgi:hypothetical protein
MPSKLPNGLWFHVGGIPEDTTPESLSAWLGSIGMFVPVTHIEIRKGRSGVFATICYPHALAVELFKWGIQGQLFNGRTLHTSYKSHEATCGKW